MGIVKPLINNRSDQPSDDNWYPMHEAALEHVPDMKNIVFPEDELYDKILDESPRLRRTLESTGDEGLIIYQRDIAQRLALQQDPPLCLSVYPHGNSGKVYIALISPDGDWFGKTEHFPDSYTGRLAMWQQAARLVVADEPHPAVQKELLELEPPVVADPPPGIQEGVEEEIRGSVGDPIYPGSMEARMRGLEAWRSCCGDNKLVNGRLIMMLAQFEQRVMELEDLAKKSKRKDVSQDEMVDLISGIFAYVKWMTSEAPIDAANEELERAAG